MANKSSDTRKFRFLQRASTGKDVEKKRKFKPGDVTARLDHWSDDLIQALITRGVIEVVTEATSTDKDSK